jgi:hypothetical protein
VFSKPLLLEDSCAFVSRTDPAIDWDKARQSVLDAPDYRVKLDEAIGSVSPDIAAAMRATDANDQDVARIVFLRQVTIAITKHPGKSVEIYPAKDGERPTRFILGVIPPSDLARIADETAADTAAQKGNQLFWRAFLSGLRDVENWPTAVEHREIDGVKYVDPAWLRRTFVRQLFATALDVGQAIWHWNKLGGDDAKN